MCRLVWFQRNLVSMLQVAANHNNVVCLYCHVCLSVVSLLHAMYHINVPYVILSSVDQKVSKSHHCLVVLPSVAQKVCKSHHSLNLLLNR
jgi:hypothetical protein